LVVFDMEGTLTANPTLWELMHLKVGTWESHGAPYWEAFKAGQLDYDRFARMDVAAWKGADVATFDRAVSEVPLMPGCGELLGHLHRKGIRTAIVSNGLERLGLRLAREFSIWRVMANREVIEQGRLTGELDIRVPYTHKALAVAQAARELGVPMEQVAAVGDGRADVAMFRVAGTSVAFRPENAAVAAEADHVVHEPDLRRLMEVL
jgi:phosphoserine phosphatase